MLTLTRSRFNTAHTRKPTAAALNAAQRELSGVSILYAEGARMGAKGEFWQIEAFAPTREGVQAVMARHLISAAKHEPEFWSNSIIADGEGFVCRGRQYRYDVLAGRS